MNNEFYEDEVIEGFYVPAMLKKAWGAQLDVLNETDIICRRHNIPYFADWGTLLSAIRHNGYIPWDDDLDISMRRKDYERFLKYAEEELPEGFKVMHFKNHPGHHFFVARIVGKPRICFEEDHLTRFHGFPYIVGIDLFVLDNVYRDRKKEKLRTMRAEYVLTVADNIADGKTKGREAEEQIRQCEEYTGKKIDRRLSGEQLRIRMYELVEGLFASASDDESDELVQMMPFGMYDNELYIPKEYYRETVRIPYMDTSISVPVCYDAVMRRKFGNYMQIHKTGSGHDYPFFYKQHEQLLEVLDFEYPSYKASYEDVMTEKELPSCEREIKDIVFIPFSPKYWKYMEKLFVHYADDDNSRVFVLPIPYYYKAWDSSLAEEVFDTDGYPADLYLQDYREVDLQSFHPDMIVIQNPYDEWNATYSVPPEYYSSKLKQYTDELVYLPFFVTDDFTKENGREYVNMDHYVCMPGVINANRIILPSETLKKVYIDKITEFIASDAPEVLRKLDGKITVSPEFVYDESEQALPEKEETKGRKILVFHTSISFLSQNGKRAIEKINDVIDTFLDNSGRLKIVWVSSLIRENAGKIEKDVSDDFREAVLRFEKAEIGEYIEDITREDIKRYAKICDAYYGDPSYLALECFYEHKPVMIADASVLCV